MSIDLGVMGAKVSLDTRGFSQGIDRVKNGFNQIGNDAQRSVKKINLNFDKIAMFATRASIAIAAVGTATVGAADQFSKGAALMDQRRVFEGLADNIGRQAEDMIRQLKMATKGALSEINAMGVSTQAIMSGMDFDNVTVALEYLQRYAKATGKSFEQLTTTIMTGLARGSVLMLDDAGIILDQASLIADAEKRIGNSLTEVEKKQLLVNAAIEQMKRKLPALGGSVSSVSDKLTQMRTSLTDFKNAMQLKGFEAGMSGLKWISQRFYDLTILMNDIVIGATIMKNGFTNAIGDMTITVNQTLMDWIIELRNALSHSLSGLWEQDNPIANAMKASLNATVSGLDGTLNALFNMNEGFLNAEKDQNAKLSKLYKVREELIKDQAEWMQTFTIPEDTGTNQGSFDLSGTVGDSISSSGTRAIDDMKQAIKALQDQLNDLSFEKSLIGIEGLERAMMEAAYETDRMREHYATLADGNPVIGQMIDQIQELKEATAQAADEFQRTQEKFKNFSNVLGSALENFTQPLADALTELAKSGETNLKDLASSLVETLQVYAAQKTAHFLMEGTYRSIMALVDKANRSKWLSEAATAFEGAAVMGGFVAGSGLAGMAHDGISNIPEDGTWLLQKNERVVDADTNADLKNFLNNNGTKPNVNMTVNINGGDQTSIEEALPKLKETILEIWLADYTSGGDTFQTVRNY